MTAPLRLVLFDVDGTLVDSQVQINGAMQQAFASLDLPCPDRDRVLSVVGLSVPQAVARLAPDLDPDRLDALAAAYRGAYADQRGDTLPALFAGAHDVITALAARDDVFLGTATGMSCRGLRHLLDGHGLAAHFATLQCADHHPSKPHPSMIWTALEETGVQPEDTVIVGDTTFDIEMARLARVASVGVSWGYHPVAQLQAAGARTVIDRFADLLPILDEIWGTP